MASKKFWTGFEKAAVDAYTAMANEPNVVPEGPQPGHQAEGLEPHPEDVPGTHPTSGSGEPALVPDVHGGLAPSTPEEAAVAQEAGLITLPPSVAGATCESCTHAEQREDGTAFCTLLSLPVTPRMCCNEYMNPEMVNYAEPPPEPEAADPAEGLDEGAGGEEDYAEEEPAPPPPGKGGRAEQGA